MTRVTREDIAAALAKVIDEESGKDVVSSGMLQGLVVREGHVGFSLEVDPAKGLEKEPLRQACEAAAKNVPGVLSVTAVLTAHRDAPARPSPGHAHAHSHSGGSARAPQGSARIPGVKAIVAVASGKGGVGKSTTACNLALALARTGLSVGVLDADIYGPSMPRLFALKGRPQVMSGRTLKPLEGYGLKVMSIGFLVDEEAAMIWRGPMVMSAIQQMLREVAWGELDVLVVDMPPGTGDAQLTMAQAVPLAGAVIVSTPQDLALIDARRGIAMFRRVDVPILGIVENMSTFICPHCGNASEIFGHGGARHEAERLGVPFLGEVPLHMTIREKSDAGLPVVVSEPDGPHAQAYLDIARKIAAALTGGTTGRAAPRIVIE